MKKLLLVAILLAMLLTVLSACVADVPFKGAGTSWDPYIIETASDICELSRLVNGGNSFKRKFFRQTEDIDLSGIDWVPVGSSGTDNSFEGTYDGNGRIITGLETSREGGNGLFGRLGGTVMNLSIENSVIRGDIAGSIACSSSGNKGLIINCCVKATVIAAEAGGIAHDFNGMILNCRTDCTLEGEITGDVCAGALAFGANNRTEEGVKADEMNATIPTSAYSAGIDMRELNLWKDIDGEAFLTSEKREMSSGDIPWIIKTGRYKAYLIILTVICLTAFVLAIRRRKRTAV